MLRNLWSRRWRWRVICIKRFNARTGYVQSLAVLLHTSMIRILLNISGHSSILATGSVGSRANAPKSAPQAAPRKISTRDSSATTPPATRSRAVSRLTIYRTGQAVPFWKYLVAYYKKGSALGAAVTLKPFASCAIPFNTRLAAGRTLHHMSLTHKNPDNLCVNRPPENENDPLHITQMSNNDSGNTGRRIPRVIITIRTRGTSIRLPRRQRINCTRN